MGKFGAGFWNIPWQIFWGGACESSPALWRSTICCIRLHRFWIFLACDITSIAEHPAAVIDEFRPTRFGSEQYSSGMALAAPAKKLFRTPAKVIPQCGMVSQAVAFNSDSSLAFPEVVEICLKAILLRIWNDQSDDPLLYASEHLCRANWRSINTGIQCHQT
jgi:hypothetical protein